MSHSNYMRRYNRTIKGFLVCKHAKMVQRVRGHNGPKDYLYIGLPIMSSKDFYCFALNNKKFNRLFTAYKNSGWRYSLCPSVDRIVPSKGYSKGNIRFVTMKENQLQGRINSAKARKAV